MNMRLVLLNAVLVLVVATLVFQFRRGLLDYEATHDVSSIQAEAEIDISIAGIEGLEPGSERSDWNLVSVLNPFSADRNDIAVLAPVPASEAVDTGGAVTTALALIGTLLLGDERVALMNSLQDPAYVSLRVGETIAGWQLVEIDRKSVVVEATGRRRNVVMNDPTMSVSGARTRAPAAPATVVASQSSTPAPTPDVSATQAAPQATPQPEPARECVIQTPFGPTTRPC